MKRIQGEKCYLSDLKKGQSAKILDLFITPLELKIHLMEMGFVKGTKIQILRTVWLGDCMIVQIRGFQFAIEKVLLHQLLVEVE